MRQCRNTPPAVARLLRQEANFGCAVCGHPLIDNAHIIPYCETGEFLAEDMIALCPTCHRMADGADYGEPFLRKHKANPRNKTHVGLEEGFFVNNKDLIVNIGGNRLINTPKVIIVKGSIDIISAKKGDSDEVLLDVNFYDKNNTLVAKVAENSWTVLIESVWDLIYKPKELTIMNKPRDIGLSIKIENGEIFIKGVLYFNGFPIKITDRYLEAGPIRLSGSTFTNGINGLSIDLGP